jgi:hypothetical protein
MAPFLAGGSGRVDNRTDIIRFSAYIASKALDVPFHILPPLQHFLNPIRIGTL